MFYKNLIHKIHISILSILIILMFAKCEKHFEWDYTEGDTNYLVVDALLTNEFTYHSVILSKAKTHPNDNSEFVTNANIEVKFSTYTFNFVHDSLQPGTYKSSEQFASPVGYPIVFKAKYNGTEYIGQDEMIPVSPMKRASFIETENNSNMYRILLSGDAFESNEQAMWTFVIDWSFLPEYQEECKNVNCKALVYWYNLHSIDVGKIFGPQTETLTFPKGAHVTQSKYSLSDEHARFRRSLLLETQWRGGLFDVSPGKVYTNINNNAVGFFGTSTVVRDSFYIE